MEWKDFMEVGYATLEQMVAERGEYYECPRSFAAFLFSFSSHRSTRTISLGAIKRM